MYSNKCTHVDTENVCRLRRTHTHTHTLRVTREGRGSYVLIKRAERWQGRGG